MPVPRLRAARTWWLRVRTSLPAIRRWRGWLVFGLVSGLGWVVVVVALVSWLVARRLGWEELGMISATAGVAVLIALGFTISRVRLRVDVTVTPERVVAGETMYGTLRASNITGRRQLPLSVELPIGARITVFPVPGLPGGGRHEDTFRLPTTRRGVIDVGPARVVRTDPLGLARRQVQLSGMQRLYVHPVTSRLEPLGAGFIRDLEGRSSEQLSVSDLAFHALREYVPGDDLRHVHWRTSAKMASASGTATLLVRQYVDTRRSRLALVLSCDPAEYDDAEEFELAISVVGSIGLRALADGLTLSLLIGDRELPCAGGQRLLDGLAELAFGGATGLADGVLATTRNVPDASVIVLAAGSPVSASRYRLLCAQLGTDPRVVGVRATSRSGAGRQSVGALSLVTLNALSDLPHLIRSTGRG